MIKKYKIPILLFLTWGLYFIFLFIRMIFENDQGISVGHANVWSDWPLHIGMATIFADKNPADWFAYHPLYAEGQMTYPFLTNFISGMLMRLGLKLEWAFIIPSVIYSLLLVTGMYLVFCYLLKSTGRAFVAVSLFFLSSGLGFIDYFKDLFSGTEKTLSLPLKEYSRMDSLGWYSGNFIVGHLAPQRAMLLGMTICIWVMVALFKAINSDKDRRRYFILAGLGLGILPITHVHSFIAMLFLLLPVAIRHRKIWREQLWCLVPSILLSGSLFFIFVFGGVSNPQFMRWFPGYNTQSFGQWLLFWFKAWGMLLPLTILAWVVLRRKISSDLKSMLLGSILLFIACNLILFQPVSWDNSKLFAWCYFVFVGVVAFLLGEMWCKSMSLRATSAVLMVILTLTGLGELTLLQRMNLHTHQIISHEELKLAEEIRNKTEPLARFLTAPSHNHWVMIRGGRSILMGFTPWVWNYGFVYAQTEIDLKSMFRGEDNAKKLLSQYKINYVVIGPGEKGDLKADENFYRKNFPVAFQSQNYLVFDVRGSNHAESKSWNSIQL